MFCLREHSSPKSGNSLQNQTQSLARPRRPFDPVRCLQYRLYERSLLVGQECEPLFIPLKGANPLAWWNSQRGHVQCRDIWLAPRFSLLISWWRERPPCLKKPPKVCEWCLFLRTTALVRAGTIYQQRTPVSCPSRLTPVVG